MHHPRFSSGLHGSDTTLGALWTTLSRGGVDIVLAGHDHHYERFAPFEGIRAFVVGSGGRSHYPVLRRLSRPKSVALDDLTVRRPQADAARRGLRLAVRPRCRVDLHRQRLVTCR